MAALTSGSSSRKATAEQANTIWATGRRKTAVARVRLNRGDGRVVVNGRVLEDYFGRETSRMIVQQPFDVTNSHGQFAIDVNIKGGGLSAQAVAIRHGITRALMAANAELRGPLKKAG